MPMLIRVRGRAVDGGRPAPPRRTVTRLRLTCVYGGVFMLAGTALLAVVLLLARQAVDRGNEPVFELRSEGTLVLAPADCPLPEAAGQQAPCPAADRRPPGDPLTSPALLVLAALGPLSVVAGYVTAGYALSPVRRIAHTARAVGH
ncbi:hypothetical protein EF912_32685 [Streptomyces sp. WAC07061]|uniref:hypothetical protein n=1 Tax=Streptomyces sp. WAC07061 TaxID=2487410 RepID=UPI000F7B6B6B|nr:hypothetical protein [Streptomyces sp. WAC07061]RSS39941.1 hypothetical protein EF912_32685 [Streptomyces sp. WAC07061]